MSLINPDEIPEYREAVGREQSARDLAFQNTLVPLCGLAVRQFTARHFLQLINLENKFVVGGIPRLEDVLQFMWTVSPDYCLDLTKRDEFVKGFVNTSANVAVIEEIVAYLSPVMMDAPIGGGRAMDKLYTSMIGGLVDLIAHEYGWDDESILEKPMARLFQYRRIIVRRRNPRTILFNRSDKVLADTLLNGHGRS